MKFSTVRGSEHLAATVDRDVCLEARLERCRDKTRVSSLILPAGARNAVSSIERQRAAGLSERRGSCGSRSSVTASNRGPP
jgi:hypothetical protein